MTPKSILLIGAGHNALVAGAYLALAGHEVHIIDARDQAGGAACTDTTSFPGYKISKFSYLNSLFMSEIVSDLGLERFGYEMRPRNPSSFTPIPGSTKSLLLGRDMAFNQAQIAQFSKRDAEMYPLYEERLGEIADWMSQMMAMVPPSGPWPRKMTDLASMLRFARHIMRLNPVQMVRLARLLLSDPIRYLDSWFESDVLKATLITDALIGATKLSGYVLLHHVMGDAGGTRGIWGYMCGGMGSISNALAAVCKEQGVKITLNASAERIVLTGTNKHRASGVVANIRDPNDEAVTQRFFEADIIVSAVNPSITFGKLLATDKVADKVRTKVLARDSESASMKINLALKGLPNFRAMPGSRPGPQHQGTIHIAPSVEYVREALQDLKKGWPSAQPILEITIPSVVDDTLAPEGCHVMNIFLQFVPYHHPTGDWQTEKMDYFWNVVMPLLREYISNIDEILAGIMVLTPQDIERELGMVGGNIFHGGMGLDQLWWNRPAPGLADYRTPIHGLYLTGAGMHPGGGVCGAAGYNTARVILADLKS